MLSTSSHNPHHKWLTLLSVAGWFLFFALTLAAPPLAGGPGMFNETASVTLGIVLMLGVLMLGERPKWSGSWRLIVFIVGLALIFVPYFLQIKWPFIRAFSGLGLLCVALPVGYWLGNHMEKVTNLIPLAVAMSMADIFSVFQGLTRVVTKDISNYQAEQTSAGTVALSQAPPGQEMDAAREAMAQVYTPLSDFIIAHFPVAGSGITIPVMGIGDFIVLGFLFRAAWLHQLRPRVVFIAALLSTIAALTASSLLARFGPPAFAHGTPALPFIALGTVGTLWLTEPRMRRLDRQEKLLTALVAAVFSALILAGWANAI